MLISIIGILKLKIIMIFLIKNVLIIYVYIKLCNAQFKYYEIISFIYFIVYQFFSQHYIIMHIVFSSFITTLIVETL